jgi:hypothetical protein
MKALIVGAREPTDALAARLAAQGIEADVDAPEGEGAAGEQIPVLAASLVALESRIVAERPGTVVLADRGDHALAAALVATKLLVPVLAVAGNDAGGGSDAGTGENERLLALLAESAEIGSLPTLLRR